MSYFKVKEAADKSEKICRRQKGNFFVIQFVICTHLNKKLGTFEQFLTCHS